MVILERRYGPRRLRDDDDDDEKQEEMSHHEQTPSAQKSFTKDVRALVAGFEDLVNPFEEDSQDLLAIC